MKAQHLPENAVNFIELNYCDIWLRDIGPIWKISIEEGEHNIIWNIFN